MSCVRFPAGKIHGRLLLGKYAPDSRTKYDFLCKHPPLEITPLYFLTAALIPKEIEPDTDNAGNLSKNHANSLSLSSPYSQILPNFVVQTCKSFVCEEIKYDMILNENIFYPEVLL